MFHTWLICSQIRTCMKVDRVASTLPLKEPQIKICKRGNLRGHEPMIQPCCDYAHKQKTNRMLIFSLKSKRRGSNFPRRDACGEPRSGNPGVCGAEEKRGAHLLLSSSCSSSPRFIRADLAVAQPSTRASP